MIPNGWKKSSVGENVKFVGGSQPPKSTFSNKPLEGYVRLLQTRDYRTDKYKTYIPKEKASRWCSVNDVMIGRYGPPIFQILRGLEGSYNVALIKAIPLRTIDREFMYYFLCNEILYHLIDRLSVRSSGQTGIEMDALKSFPLPLPPLPEQKKIAEILGACDEAIEAQERLITQKQHRKKGLMQQLLTGEVRFPVFEGTAWREVGIGSLLKEVKRPVEWDDEDQYRLLSLRRRSGGPFARESLYGREIKTKTLKTVRTGDFLIAKMQVTHGALGMVTPEFDQYKVSASYICLVPRDKESFDIRFFNYLSQLRYIWHLAYVASYGVTIEKMTFVPKDFLKKKISVPSTKEECSAIADFIDSVNEEITLQQNKLEQLKQQKKGLMQQLLTGKVRVTV